jgi:hypothetical protein
MKNKIITFINSAIMMALFLTIAGYSAAYAAQPTIDKTTILVEPQTNTTFNPATSTLTYGWLPWISFNVNGPVPSGSLISVEMSKPDGKSWVAFDCETDSVAAGEVLKINRCGGNKFESDRMSTAAGQYGFKISIKNELEGLNQTLFSGKLKANKAFYKKDYYNKDGYEWYVDYDWALPIAEIFPDATEWTSGRIVEKEVKPLMVSFWFRGATDGKSVAYLFYKGNQIASTETTEEGGSWQERQATLLDIRTFPFSWVKNRYHFTHVLVSNSEKPDRHTDAFRMDKNPGEYEVKILRKGKLVRTAKFTVGADGKIVDNGVTGQNDLGTERMTVFANVLGDEEGRQPDLAAWKSTAYFEGPLKGFGQ